MNLKKNNITFYINILYRNVAVSNHRKPWRVGRRPTTGNEPTGCLNWKMLPNFSKISSHTKRLPTNARFKFKFSIQRLTKSDSAESASQSRRKAFIGDGNCWKS
jgi:hypothetical protein